MEKFNEALLEMIIEIVGEIIEQLDDILKKQIMWGITNCYTLEGNQDMWDVRFGAPPNLGSLLNMQMGKVKIFTSLPDLPNCTKPIIATGAANRWFLTEYVNSQNKK